MNNKESAEVNKNSIKLEDDELESISGGEDREFCPNPCDGSLVGNCNWHGNCPFKEY